MKDYPYAFNGDTILQATFAGLVSKHAPQVILETGTHHGGTSEFLADFGLPFIGTEIDPEALAAARLRLSQSPNIMLLHGDSARVLHEAFHLLETKRMLAFLDSHWHSDRVLERELELFVRLHHKPVLVIHDFHVPGKDFGYDTWDGHRYDYEFYQSYFDAIYGEDGYSHTYNSEATGARRGVIILEPKTN